MKRLLLAVPVLVALGGCAGAIDVKPYERAWLADPLMSFSRDPLADTVQRHVYEVREGARGAAVGEGGGCGCN